MASTCNLYWRDRGGCLPVNLSVCIGLKMVISSCDSAVFACTSRIPTNLPNEFGDIVCHVCLFRVKAMVHFYDRWFYGARDRVVVDWGDTEQKQPRLRSACSLEASAKFYNH